MLKKMLVFPIALSAIIGAWPILAVVRESVFEGAIFVVAAMLALMVVFAGFVSAVMCFAPDVAARPLRVVPRVVVACLYGLAILGATLHLTHGFWTGSA